MNGGNLPYNRPLGVVLLVFSSIVNKHHNWRTSNHLKQYLFFL